MSRLLPGLLLVVVFPALLLLSTCGESPLPGVRDWRYYGGDLSGNRYSALDQINRSNVSQLQVAWTHQTGERRYSSPEGGQVHNPRTSAEDVTAGDKIFVTQCAACHGEDGKGGAGTFASDLTGKELKYGSSDAALFAVTFEGIPSAGMPGLYASEDEVWQIVSFVRSLRGEDPSKQPESEGQSRVGWGAGARWATIECTPIVVDGVMYISTLFTKVTVLDAATGQEIWTFDPYQDSRFRGYNRGVMYWADGEEKRIYFTAGDRLFALNAGSGKPIIQFGEQGSVDLNQGFDREVNYITVTSPGVIYKNLLILGSSTYAGLSAVGRELGQIKHAPGHLRAFDIHTGKQVWIFYTIPRPGEFGYETWPPDAWKEAYGANNWGGLRLDRERGLVFAGTAAAYYPPPRYGKNLFANTVLALKAETGERVWHFQVIHHDVWDLDIPCPANLVTVEHNGRRIDALAQTGKHGMVFLLNRETGEPLFPVEERPVSTTTDIEGEKLWPTQPFTVKPPPYSRHGLTKEDVTDVSPEARAHVLEQLKEYSHGGPYEPLTKRGTVILPGIHGGNNWGGASYDPTTGWLYVNSNEIPWRFGPPYTNRFEDNRGYPAVKPPWGKLNAIDLNEGEIVWQVPLGELEELTEQGIPATGTENLGGTIVTAGGLVFVGATKDGDFRAFDKTTGELLWKAELPAIAYATPATYEVNGRQYVVIVAAGGGGMQADYILEDSAGYQAHRRFQMSDTFLAFALP